MKEREVYDLVIPDEWLVTLLDRRKCIVFKRVCQGKEIYLRVSRSGTLGAAREVAKNILAFIEAVPVAWVEDKEET